MSCCTLCREPGSATSGSWGRRSAYQLPDHAGHGDDDWKEQVMEEIIILTFIINVPKPKSKMFMIKFIFGVFFQNIFKYSFTTNE